MTLRFGQPGDVSCDRVVTLACDRRYSDNPSENLAGHILQGTHDDRTLAIKGLGALNVYNALPLLTAVLSQCARSLDDPSLPLELPGSSGYALSVASEICQTLARLDCKEAHRVLVETCTRKGNRYLRAAAISATALESNWQDVQLLRRYLGYRGDALFRIAAANAIHECSGFRLQTYKPLILPLLHDKSPCVVISAVEVLALRWARDEEIPDLLLPLLSDHRFCKMYRTTVSKFVSGYFSD